MPKASYSPEVRDRALAIYLEHGPAEASRQTGISKQTIASWGRRNGLHTNATANTQEAAAMRHASTEDRLTRLAETLVRIAHDRAEWVVEQAPGKDVRAPMTVAAIAIDKAQLLTGKPTSRIESVEPKQREILGKLLELRQAS